MAGQGRHTEYKAEYVGLAQQYLESCVDTYIDGKIDVNLPTIEGLALFLHVSRASVYVWADENPDFADTLQEILAKQKQKLVNSGLAEKYNSTIAKLILSANHNMREKTDLTSDDKPIQQITGMQIIDDRNTANSNPVPNKES